LEGGAKITTFFHLCKGQGIFPFPCRKKIHFAASVLSQKVAFLIGTYPCGTKILQKLKKREQDARHCGGTPRRQGCKNLYGNKEVVGS